MSNNTVSDGMYANYAQWLKTNDKVSTYVGKINSNTTSAFDEIDEKHNLGEINDDKYIKNQKEIRNYFIGESIKASNYEDELGSFDYTLGGKLEYSDALTSLAQGYFDSADLDKNGSISLNEFTSEEFKTSDDYSDFIKEGSQKDVELALENGEDITSYLKDEYVDIFQAAYDEINLTNEEEGDSDEISLDEMKYNFALKDKADGKVDGIIKSSSAGGELFSDDITIQTDSDGIHDSASIYSKQSLIKNIYGVSFYSREGQAKWKEIQEMNPDMDLENFDNGQTIVLKQEE